MSKQQITQITVYHGSQFDNVHVAIHRSGKARRPIRNYEPGPVSAHRIERIMCTPPTGWVARPPIVAQQCIAITIVQPERAFPAIRTMVNAH